MYIHTSYADLTNNPSIDRIERSYEQEEKISIDIKLGPNDTVGKNIRL